MLPLANVNYGSKYFKYIFLDMDLLIWDNIDLKSL